MSEHFITRPYRPGDEDGILELLDRVFNRWPSFDLDCSVKEHYTWKYLDTPFKEKVITVATINKEIIGVTHGTIKRVKVGEIVSLTGMGSDASVSPDYRKLGVFNKLLELQNETCNKLNIRYWQAISANPILIQRNLRIGNLIFPKDISPSIRVKDVSLHLQHSKIEKEALFSYGYRIMSKLNSLKSSHNENNSIIIKGINRFDKNSDVLWNRVKENYNYSVVRDMEFLNWRYCDLRGGNYIKKGAFEDGDFVGYIVLRVNSKNKDYPEAYIVDLLALPMRTDIIERLVEESLTFLDDASVNSCYFLGLKNHPYEDVLNGMGFVGYPHEWRIVLFKKFTPPMDFALIKNSPTSRIMLSYGDHDWI